MNMDMTLFRMKNRSYAVEKIEYHDKAWQEAAVLSCFCNGILNDGIHSLIVNCTGIVGPGSVKNNDKPCLYKIYRFLNAEDGT